MIIDDDNDVDDGDHNDGDRDDPTCCRMCACQLIWMSCAKDVERRRV